MAGTSQAGLVARKCASIVCSYCPGDTIVDRGDGDLAHPIVWGADGFLQLLKDCRAAGIRNDMPAYFLEQAPVPFEEYEALVESGRA